jgi:alpha-methylacyl-CoA racemase
MLLSDLGAEVLRIDRADGNGWDNPIMDRGRAVLRVDIREASGRDLCIAAATRADVLVEGMRPGVMERLGLGPDVLCEKNPRLVYTRITGWGQHGKRANTAGHDIDYIALTGALAAIGRPGETAVPPLNLVGDLGGGSMLAAFGILAALWERASSGRGQVIDAAIVDGVASFMGMFAGLVPRGAISLERDRNVLGGAAPFYRCYACADGREVAVGAIEPQFYRMLIERLGAPPHFYADQYEQSNWPARTAVLAQLFAQKARDEWLAIFDDAEACVAPVLTLSESFADRHLIGRGTYTRANGLTQAAPVPRFSRTPGGIQPTMPGSELLSRWGIRFPAAV